MKKKGKIRNKQKNLNKHITFQDKKRWYCEVLVADECRIQEEPNPFYRWNQKGITPIMKVARSYRAISYYGALSLNTGEEIAHICTWQNPEETIKFLEVMKKRYTGNVLLIWDNGSWHKPQHIKDWLTQNPGCIELMNFPVYSANLNPLEHVWKTLKAELSHYLRSYSWKVMKDHACFFLKIHTFNYSL